MSQIKSKILFDKKYPLNSLDSLAKKIYEYIKKRGVIFLEGTLGAGKTTFAKALGKVVGIENVDSPTFSLVQEYDNSFYHYDFYRKSLRELIDLGIISNLEEDGIHLIEWGSRELLEFLVKSGFNVYRLKIDIVSDSEREYKFEEFYYA